MVVFRKPQEYIARPEVIRLLDFHDRKENFVTRPPYQRKAVWGVSDQRALLDSIFRGYYVPRLLLRQVSVGDGVKFEVIDGQQRITVMQRFFNDEIALPYSLGDVRDDLPNKFYSKLPDDVKAFVEHEQYEVDMIYGIDNPFDIGHQRIATEIFRRLQEGESLTNMEKNHARINSLVRNFLVKYADDISFDYHTYEPLDYNDSKHQFFTKVYRGTNSRMQHLAFLCRLLLVEEADGPTDVTDSVLTRFIARAQVDNGIGNLTFEREDIAKNVLSNMSLVVDIFEHIDSGSLIYHPAERFGQYLTLSIYLLIRHLNNTFVINVEQKHVISDFVIEFYRKWLDSDSTIWRFDRNSQNNRNAIATRHAIITGQFFEFVENSEVEFQVSTDIAEDPE